MFLSWRMFNIWNLSALISANMKQQAVPINGDNLPPLWPLPTLSRNIFGRQKAENDAREHKNE